MKKNLMAFVSCILLIAVVGCEKNKEASGGCFPDVATVMKLTNKPAAVRLLGSTFYIIEEHTYDSKLIPCNLPEEFKVDHLKIIVSGNVKATVRNAFEPCCTDDFEITDIVMDPLME